MAFQRVETILRHTHGLRERIRQAVRTAYRAERDPMVTELLRRIEEHDRRMQQLLSGHSEAAPQEVLDTWIQFPDTEPLEREISELGFDGAPPDDGSKEVIGKALELDRRILDLYRTANEQVSAPRVKDFFGLLMMMQEQQACLKSRDAVETQDL